jgi:tetratricopeptide (TPR) repeat protein
MKHSSVLFCLFSICLFALFNCKNTPSENTTAQAKFTTQTTVEIPKLLDRPEALRYGTEWDAVQNAYGTQAAALRQDPTKLEAYLKLAEVFIQEARITGEHPHYYPAALQMLEPVIKNLGKVSKPKAQESDLLFRALSHKASVQLSLHDFAEAQKTASAAAVINPYNAYIYGCLVDANVELGQYAKAVEFCDKMVGIRPDLRSYSRVSYLREIHGEVQGAIEAMDMAVKAGYPGYEQTEWARLQLGKLHERYGKLEDAEKQYRICLAIRENYPFALAALAGIEAKRGNYQEAESLLRQAMSSIPEVGFYSELAKIYQKTGRAAAAEKLIKKIDGMLAEDMAAGHNMRMEMAYFYLDLSKDLEKAFQYANEEYQIRPENNDVNQLMAAVYLARGNKKQARIHLDKAAATGSKNPELAALQQKI